MGTNLEICLLTDKESSDVFPQMYRTMLKNGWSYDMECGYHYYIDAPVWKFGDSVSSKVESCLGENGLDVAAKIGCFFTPIMRLSKQYDNYKTNSTIQIAEGEGEWKIAKFFIKLSDFAEHKQATSENIEEIKTLFFDLVDAINPSFALCGIEMLGMPESIDEIRICDESFGDFTYLPSNLIDGSTISSLSSDIFYTTNLDHGVIWTRKRHCLEVQT